jgi:hypothetical protein
VRVPLRSALVSLGLVGAVTLGLSALGASPVLAGDTVAVIVLKEHAVGSTTQAQPFLDKLMAAAAQENGWAAGRGSFQTKRDAADAWIKAEGPHYGILSLAPFLAFKDAYKLEAIGQAIVAGGGGQRYFMVSSTAADPAGCKGKKLATDHADDVKFIEKVVAGGAFKLADFTLDKTTRPGQAGRKVIAGEADCALIDDAQLADLGKVPGGAAVKPVWSSAQMPPMVIVAFPSAPAAERKKFEESLPRLCAGGGKQACDEVGLTSLRPGGGGDYAAVLAAYAK